MTVCKGGHCRAPLAAAVLADLGAGAVQTRAAAVKPWHIGEPAHPLMVKVAAGAGYDLTGHRGEQISPELLAWADLVIAMDAAVLDALRQIAGAHALKLRRYLDGRDVPDPWEQPETAFRACLDVIVSGAPAII
ncbi:low molecular weight phosphotyrosine protein phosphatase [Kitasatospora sp. MAA4]|uniref:arsenate reductase/protein-tyrosine-phosphatase family protein n=1 Tax=Kitasatospora sp. MAA4 TaxID=3035093 RepID=UPI0024731AA2|nr:low molecular weight phosphotyrosine protein phosphatase [Kitasatospora sp. MAA4]